MNDWTRRGILAGAATLPLSAGRARAETLPGLEALQPDATPLPELRFTDAEGAARTLADYRGQPVLINFWATWCVPCVAEMPALDGLAAAMPRLAVLPLSSDRLGVPAVQRFYAARGIVHLPTLLDPRGEAARAVGSRGIPTTLLVQPDGRPIARVEGGMDWLAGPVQAWIAGHL